MATLIKFTGKENNWQCVDNMKNELFKEWIIDNADEILTEDEVKEKYDNNVEYFDWGIFDKSRISTDYEEINELYQMFEYKDYDDIKEGTIDYNRFVWANLHDIKECFEESDVKEILKECME